MSHYSNYLHERSNDLILENEKGFVTYRFLDDGKTVYIIDIYIAPDFRNRGEASDMADLVVDLAKKRGCTKLLGSVVPSMRGSTASLKVLLGYGMTLESSGVDYIFFKKEV